MLGHSDEWDGLVVPLSCLQDLPSLHKSEKHSGRDFQKKRIYKYYPSASLPNYATPGSIYKMIKYLKLYFSVNYQAVPGHTYIFSKGL